MDVCLIQPPSQLLQKSSRRIRIEGVKAHTNGRDPHSLGNEAADKVAGRPRQRANTTNNDSWRTMASTRTLIQCLREQELTIMDYGSQYIPASDTDHQHSTHSVNTHAPSKKRFSDFALDTTFSQLIYSASTGKASPRERRRHGKVSGL